MPIAAILSAVAVVTSSSAWLAPRKNEKAVTAWSSAYTAASTQRIKSFCFFFQKEALSFLKKRNKKLLSEKAMHVPSKYALEASAEDPEASAAGVFDAVIISDAVFLGAFGAG